MLLFPYNSKTRGERPKWISDLDSDSARLHNRIERIDANFPDQNVQRHSVTSLESARSLANDPKGEGLRGNCSVSYLSLAMVTLEESVGGA